LKIQGLLYQNGILLEDSIRFFKYQEEAVVKQHDKYKVFVSLFNLTEDSLVKFVITNEAGRAEADFSVKFESTVPEAIPTTNDFSKAELPIWLIIIIALVALLIVVVIVLGVCWKTKREHAKSRKV